SAYGRILRNRQQEASPSLPVFNPAELHSGHLFLILEAYPWDKRRGEGRPYSGCSRPRLTGKWGSACWGWGLESTRAIRVSTSAWSAKDQASALTEASKLLSISCRATASSSIGSSPPLPNEF